MLDWLPGLRNTAAAALQPVRQVVALLLAAGAIWAWSKGHTLRALVLGALAVWVWSSSGVGSPGDTWGAGGGGGGAAAAAAPAGNVVEIPLRFDPTGWEVILPSGTKTTPLVAARSIAAGYPPGGVVATVSRDASRAAVVGALYLLWAHLRLAGVPLSVVGWQADEGADRFLAVAQAQLDGQRPSGYDEGRLYDEFAQRYGAGG